MKRLNLIATACMTAGAACLLAMSVVAQDFNTNERTYLTFSNTVELPGVTLQPGTYLFRLADSQSNRHIIQVLSQDEKQIHATILAVPAERMEVTGENVVTFRETAAGTTPAVRYWYYPGDKIGHEFVYPKDQALRIAKRTNENVLSTEGEVSSNSTVSSMNPSGEMSEWQYEGRTPGQTASAQQGAVQGTAGVSSLPQQTEQTASAATGTTPKAGQSTVGTTATQTAHEDQSMTGTAAMKQNPVEDRAVGTLGKEGRQAAGTSGRKNLPRTASPLPLSGLIGLLSLAGAMGLRRVRK